MKCIARMIIVVSMVGCGATTPSSSSSSSSGTSKAVDDNGVVEEEILDELNALFDRKRTAVGRCFAKAWQTGALTKKGKVHLTISVRVIPGRRSKDVHIAKSSEGAFVVHECVIGLAKTWLYPQVNRPIEYSYSYAYEQF